MGKETEQHHSRNAFTPQDAAKLTPHQKHMALESIMRVKGKRDESLKGRFCANVRKQQVTVEKN